MDDTMLSSFLTLPTIRTDQLITCLFCLVCFVGCLVVCFVFVFALVGSLFCFFVLVVFFLLAS